ncbi:MAG: hypothetical protein LIP12_08850 [Clostridiales bacterium]|nr:hypothetical protein [Clostridiales bacterium]
MGEINRAGNGGTSFQPALKYFSNDFQPRPDTYHVMSFRPALFMLKTLANCLPPFFLPYLISNTSFLHRPPERMKSDL